MICQCQTYDGTKCAARGHHLSLAKARARYGDCHCDCHEDENGNQITQAEWKALRIEPETTFTLVDSISQEAQHLRDAGKIVHSEHSGVILWSEPEEKEGVE